MMAYREGAPAAGLPFPRKTLGAFTAVTIIVAASVLLLLPLLFASPAGWLMFRNGGSGMYVLVLLALLCGAALGVLGAFAVRGKSVPSLLVAGVPAVPVLAGAVFMRAAMGKAIGAVSGGSVDPLQAMRILAEGASEADSLIIFGCAIGACAFGAATAALLGATGSVDRARSSAPAGAAWIVSLVIGVIGIVVAFGARVVMRTMLAPMMLTIPAMAAFTGLACMAARNAPLARGWHDRREANAWVASLFAAAVAAAAGAVLLDAASLFFAESRGLGAIAGESVDPSQKARILAEVVAETRAATIFACIDGFFAFATVGAGLVSAIGRGPDGSARSPLGPPAFAALASVVLVAVALFGVRAWTFAEVGRTDEARLHPDQKTRTSIIDLPHATVGPFGTGELSGPTLTVQANGSFDVDGRLGPYDHNLVVMADHRAPWGSVAKAVTATLKMRADALDSNPVAVPPTLSIRVTSDAPRAPLDLGRYGAFVGPDAPTVLVRLDRKSLHGWDGAVIMPKASDDMSSVVAAIAAASTSIDAKRVVLLPPDGAW